MDQKKSWIPYLSSHHVTKTYWWEHPIPSGYVKIAIENDPVEIVDVPIKNDDFP